VTAVPTLNHVAMSVPPGTLTEEFRRSLREFYGEMLGWQELESLARPDRLTMSVGGGAYVNVREQDPPMACTGYEHVGIVLGSSAEVDALRGKLSDWPADVHLGELQQGDDGFRLFRFRHLLPMAIEVQYHPPR
jgi:hypothetical protein